VAPRKPLRGPQGGRGPCLRNPAREKRQTTHPHGVATPRLKTTGLKYVKLYCYEFDCSHKAACAETTKVTNVLKSFKRYKGLIQTESSLLLESLQARISPLQSSTNNLAFGDRTAKSTFVHGVDIRGQEIR